MLLLLKILAENIPIEKIQIFELFVRDVYLQVFHFKKKKEAKDPAGQTKIKKSVSEINRGV